MTIVIVMDPFKERPEAGHADAHGWLLHLQLCLDCQHLLLGNCKEHLHALLTDTTQPRTPRQNTSWQPVSTASLGALSACWWGYTPTSRTSHPYRPGQLGETFHQLVYFLSYAYYSPVFVCGRKD